MDQQLAEVEFLVERSRAWEVRAVVARCTEMGMIEATL